MDTHLSFLHSLALSRLEEVRNGSLAQRNSCLLWGNFGVFTTDSKLFGICCIWDAVVAELPLAFEFYFKKFYVALFFLRGWGPRTIRYKSDEDDFTDILNRCFFLISYSLVILFVTLMVIQSILFHIFLSIIILSILINQKWFQREKTKMNILYDNHIYPYETRRRIRAFYRQCFEAVIDNQKAKETTPTRT